MQSFKDKIKSKINKSKIQQPEITETFDENSINIHVSEVKSQLDQIRLVCSWNQRTNHKIPKLNCRWYNRAENNIAEIQGVTDELYQPSLVDVGSIIEVTCVPELNGMNYEGMPILVKTNVVKLSQSTQNQANLLNSKRAKFFVDLRQYKLKGKVHSQKSEGIIIIENNKFTLNQTKFGQLNDETLLQLSLSQHYPILVPGRRNKKQIKVQFSQEQYCILQMKNNQLRDVICLLIKMKVAQIIINRDTAVDGNSAQNKDQKQIYFDLKEKKTNSEESINKNPENKAKNGSEQHLKVQKPNDKPKALQILQISNLKQQIHKLEQQNTKINKQLQQQKEKTYSLEMKNVQTKQRLQNASKNYYQLQRQLSIAKMTINQHKRTIDEFQQKLKEHKNVQVSNNEELIYYKTEMKLLKEQRQSLAKQRMNQTNKRESLQKQLQKYLQMTDNHKTYQQIASQLRQITSKYEVMELRYFYNKEQKQKLEQQLKNNKALIESIQSEKKNIEQKYLSLSYQIQNYQENEFNTPILSKASSKSSESSSLRSSKIGDYSPEKERQRDNQYQMNQKSNIRYQQVYNVHDNHQYQISMLKRQIQDLMEQKNYIKTLLLKEKKPTSRAHLKLQLFEVKKLSTRLSEAIVQNQMCISKLKQINKQLNTKNLNIQKQNNDLFIQVQRLRSIISSSRQQ